MTAGPKNSFMQRRKEQLGGEPPPAVRFCPFSIRPMVESAVVGPDGVPAAPRINASPCLGDRCVGFTVFQPSPGAPPIGECRLCMIPNLLSGAVPAMLEILDRIAVASGAPALAVVPDPAPVPPQGTPGSDPVPPPKES